MSDGQSPVWYVLRVTYSRELKVKAYLESRGLETFIPMRYDERLHGDQKVRVLVPAVHNFVFVRTSSSELKELKSSSPVSGYIRYMMDIVTHAPLVVPNKQMEDFIAVAGTPDEQVMYLSSAEVAMKKGDRVRVTGGIWEGVEGKFVRIKRGFRVVVEIRGIMAVATASLHPSLVQKIES